MEPGCSGLQITDPRPFPAFSDSLFRPRPRTRPPPRLTYNSQPYLRTSMTDSGVRLPLYIITSYFEKKGTRAFLSVSPSGKDQ